MYNHLSRQVDSRHQHRIHHSGKWLSLVAVCHADIRCSICSWLSTDRHHILAVAIRDIGVARQIDHAAHVAHCAGADDDEIALMSAELLPRLEGGIRAALEEVDNL